ncbi:MAG: hypothetical protein SO366_02800 [Atopobiaceae bacterium]|nr:hypothetical protein [Atopobiaceae bacterium]
MRDMAIWEDGSRRDIVSAWMVDPHSLDSVRGEVQGLMREGCSLTMGYYTDNRLTGQMQTLGRTGWQDGSWVRLVLECPDYAYRAELATLIPSRSEEASRAGATEISWDLQSQLWAISEDTLPSHFSIGQGALATDVFRRICSTVGKECSVLPGTYEHRYQQTVAYELGDSFRSDLYDVCTKSGNRLDTDEHGRITMGPYVAPSKRSPDWVLDTASKRSIVLDDGYGWTDEFGSVPSRSVVIYKQGDTEIAAAADVPTTSRHSPSRRGYTVAEQHSLTDMSPATQAQAQRLADEYIKADSDSKRELTVKTLYFPVRAGDMVLWRDGGEETLCLAKEADIDLGKMTIDLTLKEA